MNRDFELSSYQQDIMDYVSLNRGNLLIDAKAGSGKTSTLILIADEIIKQNGNCLFLSFNKSIVEELQMKLPNLANKIKTVHSLGQSFIRSYLYKKHNTNYELLVESGKLRTLVREYYELSFQERIKAYCEVTMGENDIKDLHNNLISDFVTICNFVRLYGRDYNDAKSIDYITNRFCRYIGDYIDEVIPNYYDLIYAVLNKTIDMFENPTGTTVDGKPIYIIDFVDMIYFPVYFNMSVPYSLKNSLDTVLIDESQDLSMLQQLFIRKLNTGFNRFIFVGDRNQSIYGFNGADTEAIDRIKFNFTPKELPLSICYRCPEKIVRLAQRNVPSIEWNTARVDKGTLETMDYDKMKLNIKPGEVIIGRRNRDLLQIYRDFVLRDKRPVRFKNRDLVNAINRDITSCVKDYLKLYAKNQNIDRVVYEHMEQYEKETGNHKKSPLYKGEMDQFIKEYIKEHKEDFRAKKIMKTNHTLDYLITCMEEYKNDGAYNYEEDTILTEYYETILEFMEEFKERHSSILVKDFLDYIESFLTASLDQYNVPVISSIHSMKGGEADTVYIYDYPRFPYGWADMSNEDMQQEENLQYVAITRAKKNLYLLLMDISKAKDEKQADRIEAQNSETIAIVNDINQIVNVK